MLKWFLFVTISADVFSVVLTTECKSHEEYSDCINSGLFAQNCSQLGYPMPYDDLDPKNCITGYICESGYTRADNGTCIPSNQCPSCGGDPNAESGCGVFCEKCSNYNTGPLACPAFCLLNGCECKAGYIYDQNIKKCVLPKQCTPTCKINEVYSNCINGGCDARNCSQLGKPVPCVKLRPDACIKGCVCDSGYLRAANGTCIPVKECPSCGDDPNAESGCGVFCEKCSNYKKRSILCPRICKVNGCQCKKGHIYDQNIKKCVLPVQCTPTCNINEVYSDCINGGCDARNCSQLGKPVRCVKLSPDACIKGYVCDSGYLRAANGTCIPVKECPSCGDDPNAESGCGVFCENCSNYNKGPIACPDICELNGCQCKEGYIYDQNIRKCVLPKQCTPTCKVNEVYSACINGGCDARNCSQLGNPVPCVNLSPDACIKGCVCASGYLRSDNGTCIPVKQCPTCGGDPNAESGCGVFCNRCSGPFPCPKICKVNGCQCKQGYIYDQNTNMCVLPKQCTPTCKSHEVFYNCINGGCAPRDCTELGKPTPCRPMPPGSCIRGCVCESGYLRNDNGTCIPQDQCPPTCKSHEVLYNCINGGCAPRDCTELGKPTPCRPMLPGSCIRGCVCESGYLRNDNGTCIPQDQCPPTCKSHEVLYNCINGGCAPRDCTELGKPTPCRPMLPGSCIRGCVCESGYLRNDNGTCIPQDQCPKCEAGEIYSKCANGVCRLQNCSQYGQPIPYCPAFNPDKCTPGCICANEYLRNEDGICVPQEDCPEAQITTTTSTPDCNYDEE